jgi:hypothetical protein
LVARGDDLEGVASLDNVASVVHEEGFSRLTLPSSGRRVRRIDKLVELKPQLVDAEWDWRVDREGSRGYSVPRIFFYSHSLELDDLVPHCSTLRTV